MNGQVECLTDQMFGRCFWVGKWSDHLGRGAPFFFIMVM